MICYKQIESLNENNLKFIQPKNENEKKKKVRIGTGKLLNEIQFETLAIHRHGEERRKRKVEKKRREERNLPTEYGLTNFNWQEE